MPVDAKTTGTGSKSQHYGAGARLAFLELFVASTPAERLHSLDPDALYRQCEDLYQLGRQRQPGQTLIRSQSNGVGSVIEIITDDMPHIVDGIVALLHSHDAPIHDLTHPIIPAVRDEDGVLRHLSRDGLAESYVRIETDDYSADALMVLESGIRTLLDTLRRMNADADALALARTTMAATIGGETGALLDWLRDDTFTVLGGLELVIGLDGIARVDSRLGMLQSGAADALVARLAALPAAHGDGEPLVTGRLALASPLYHHTGIDGIAVWQRAPEGSARLLFLAGHFTIAAQTTSPRQIPVLGRRIEQVVEVLGFVPRSHNARSAIAVLEQTPRQELFAQDAEALADMVRRLLDLQNKQRVDVVVRPDALGEVTAIQVLLPTARMSKSLPERLRAMVAAAPGGSVIGMVPPMPRGSLTALEFQCAVMVPAERQPVLADALKAQIQTALRSWRDRLHDSMAARAKLAMWTRYERAFPSEYQDRYDVVDAMRDIQSLEKAGPDGIAVHLAGGTELHVKVFRAGAPVQLYRVLPLLENMGGRIIGENSVKLTPAGQAPVWMHDIVIELERLKPDLDPASLENDFADLFLNVWSGAMENDGLNRLLFAAGLTGNQIVVLRAYARYLRQIAPSLSMRTMERALTGYPQIAATLSRLFQEKFVPGPYQGRSASLDALRKVLAASLDEVSASDDDRVLRALTNLLDATLRTNAFQTEGGGTAKPYLSFKFDCARLDELPSPRPFAEIFVYSPRVEGVHLRGAKIARGGLRWSDRRDDFRTEVLGLLKAQMVKNAVIVPQGSKGGFVVKTAQPDRQAMQAEGIECYKTFIRGLLDITDNLLDGQVIPPTGVVRYDGDDPYLVVAADKGTATFSDIANTLALEYGFWLGDAFASGGSAGYDHKAMGITTRGAWEAVKRHFREMDRDIQTQPFTLAGVGDMSGDVFGNGMLQSPQTKLVAAFNHQFIFLDPAPDVETSYAERKRLFALPRSNWDDYDAGLISPGGGVFRRDAKRLSLSPEAQALLNLDHPNPTPDTVIRAILCAPVDLLFFGGIGTYVRASHENDAAAGDRANDSVRVSADQLRCKVVGEGANLAMTQAARIQYAAQGGRLNTDAVDNSAGVDCSDHEVNIKILLADALAQNRLPSGNRNALLASMTDEVASLVLRDNILQTGILSVIEQAGVDRLDRQARLMRMLDRTGRLDRALEALPGDEAVTRLQAVGRGLTRPEIAVLLAYGKNWLTDEVLASDLPADPYLGWDLAQYFPKPLRDGFADLIPRHALAREILSTILANDAANRLGAATVLHLSEETGHGAAAIVRAYVAVRDALGLNGFWQRIDGLNTAVPAAAQMELMGIAAQVMERSVERLLHLEGADFALAPVVEAYSGLVPAMHTVLDDLTADPGNDLGVRLRERQAALEGRGIPADLARDAAHLDVLPAVLDVRTILQQVPAAPAAETCRLYLQSGARLGLEWLRGTARRLSAQTYWQRRAVTDLMDDFNAHQRRLTAEIVHLATRAADQPRTADPLDHWLRVQGEGVVKLDRLMAEIRAADSLDLSMLSVANRAIARLSA